jgi:hypothetical protein
LPVAEREFLRDRAAEAAGAFGAKRAIIVNIGVHRCASMYCLRAGAPYARLFGMDIVPAIGKVAPSLKARFWLGDSLVTHAGFKEPVHLLFIDGDHHYKFVMGDLNNWASKVVPGGVVVLHDCRPLESDIKKNPHLVEVNQALEDWLFVNGENWEEMEAPHSMRAFKRL